MKQHGGMLRSATAALAGLLLQGCASPEPGWRIVGEYGAEGFRECATGRLYRTVPTSVASSERITLQAELDVEPGGPVRAEMLVFPIRGGLASSGPPALGVGRVYSLTPGGCPPAA